MIEIPKIASPVILRIVIEMDKAGQVKMEGSDPSLIPITGSPGPAHPLSCAKVLASVLAQLLNAAQKGIVPNGKENSPTIEKGS